MFATKCSFCQFDNVPGARFCAECGSPLHLKVCPGCGKVSDVTATSCEHCHAPFPRIDLAPPVTAAEAVAAPAPAPKPTPPKNTAIPVAPSANEVAPTGGMRAWPLIMVALVAGGLPLLWFNRASLPEPKTFTPPPVMPPTLPAPGPGATPAAVPSTSVPATVAAPAGPATPMATPAPSPAAAVDPAVAQPPAPDSSVEKPGASKPAVKKATPAQAQRPQARKTEAQARECTEAVAALGLCDPKQVKR